MVGAVVLLALLGLAKAPAPPAAPTRRVLVRVDYASAGKSVRIEDVTRDVSAIWKPYADVAFADAADQSSGGYDEELHLAVTDDLHRDAAGATALGWISFVMPGQPLNVVTVSVTAARTLMARERWLGQPFDRLPQSVQQELIARAVSWSVAHEIGHYLLRTTAHSPHGLMRAELAAGEVMRKDRRWVRLEPHEIAALRARAAFDGVLADADAPAARSE